MKKKLLVILGAGSSTPLGMPSVPDLDQLMAQWGIEWATWRGTTDHFGKLWQSAEMYYKRGPTGPRPALNFEKVLGDMVALAHWMEPPPWGDTLRQAVCGGAPPPELIFQSQEPECEATEDLLADEGDLVNGEHETIGESLDEMVPASEESPSGKYGAYIELMDELSFLLEKLAQHMRTLCQRLDPATAAAERYGMLLRGLREKFDVGVYNLNYDVAALNALPGAYTGFGETGTFEPSVIIERSQWDFVYHLHGSVHHSLSQQFGDDICWRRSLDEHFFDGSEGRSNDKRSEGRWFPIATLIAGGKWDHRRRGSRISALLARPYLLFWRSLTALSIECAWL